MTNEEQDREFEKDPRYHLYLFTQLTPEQKEKYLELLKNKEPKP